jgi:hypothetical protein
MSLTLQHITNAPQPSAATVPQIVGRGIGSVLLKVQRHMDSPGRCPRRLISGGRNVWRLSDLEKWVERGFRGPSIPTNDYGPNQAERRPDVRRD